MKIEYLLSTVFCYNGLQGHGESVMSQAHLGTTSGAEEAEPIDPYAALRPPEGLAPPGI